MYGQRTEGSGSAAAAKTWVRNRPPEFLDENAVDLVRQSETVGAGLKPAHFSATMVFQTTESRMRGVLPVNCPDVTDVIYQCQGGLETRAYGALHFSAFRRNDEGDSADIRWRSLLARILFVITGHTQSLELPAKFGMAHVYLPSGLGLRQTPKRAIFSLAPEESQAAPVPTSLRRLSR